MTTTQGALTDPISVFVFVLANVAIMLGYLFLSLAVVPKVHIRLLRTKVGGIGFFLLCGLTHLDMAIMAIVQDEHRSFADMATNWHMLVIHVPQAICVWLFVTGLYIEIGDFGLLRGRDAAQESDD